LSVVLAMLATDIVHLCRRRCRANNMRRNDTVLMPQ
jgi:hypothetical protein